MGSSARLPDVTSLRLNMEIASIYTSSEQSGTRGDSNVYEKEKKENFIMDDIIICTSLELLTSIYYVAKIAKIQYSNF